MHTTPQFTHTIDKVIVYGDGVSFELDFKIYNDNVLFATVTASEANPYTDRSFPVGTYTIHEITGTPHYRVVANDIEVTVTTQTPGEATFVNNYNKPNDTEDPIIPLDLTPSGEAPVVVTPELEISEMVPAAPLPQTSGLDPAILYGLGLLLAGSGIAIKRRHK